MKILRYPHKSLTTKTELITEFEPHLDCVGNKLLALIVGGKGTGLAVNQTGLNLRMFVSPILPHKIICNPTWEPTPSGFDYYVVEGCLSFPGWLVPIKRYDAIFAKYQRPNGEKVKKVFRGLAAQVFQHETAHLDGLTLLDFLTDKQKETIVNYYKQRS